MEVQSDAPAEVATPEVTNGNGATNGKEEPEAEEVASEPVEESIEAIKANLAEEKTAEEPNSEKSDPAAKEEAEVSSVPTSVISSVPKEPEDTAEAASVPEPPTATETEAPKEAEEASCTVADLIEEEEEETEPAEKKEEAMEEDKVDDKKEVETKEEEKEEVKEDSEEAKPDSEGEAEKNEEKNEEKRSQPAENKSAAELAYEWDDEGVEEEKPKTPKKETPKKSGKSAAVLRAEAEVTPGRKSSRTPKLTQKMLESQSQKNLKDPEPEESEDEADDEGEESVDAIAKELEKSDSTDSKKSPKGGKGSPKKGKKPAMEGEKSKEEWVDLIFGANGEKVTEGGKKKGEDKEAKNDAKDGDGDADGEDFVPESDTPKTKRGGRPKKKGLDETCEGVGKLGSNMYFYDGGPYMDSDEEDDRIKDKKADSEPARKSSRANKGQNKRLERADEVVAIPQVKEAPKPNLNPSWLKNHDTKKDSPAKKSASTPTPAAKSTPTAKKAAAKDKKEEVPEEDTKDDTKEDALEEEQEPMDTSTAAAPESEEEEPAATEKDQVEAEPEKKEKEKSADPEPPKDEDLPEFDPNKFEPGYIPKTVKKGDDEYAIIVSGVKDTGLCGGYWGNIEGKRRRSKPPETLQLGKNERRGSVGSVNSDKGKESPAPIKKGASTPATGTPKAGKKQVTKPEVKTEEEVKTPVTTGRGRKRKTEGEAATPTDKKAKKEAEDAKEEAGDSKEASLTSRQQSAVAQALAAGVPGGQQRSVSCVADTNTQREVVVECFAPYDDHRWVNIGKERDGMAPDAVQYARALRPPYHLLSFLRIKGHSTKGMSCTDKNTMVFVVLEGEITVILHTTQFNAKKGDSFYIPPKNYYNLINQKAREAELSLIQFQYDGPLPTVQPSN